MFSHHPLPGVVLHVSTHTRGSSEVQFQFSRQLRGKLQEETPCIIMGNFTERTLITRLLAGWQVQLLQI